MSDRWNELREPVLEVVSAGPRTTELRVNAALDQLPIVQAAARTLTGGRGFALNEIAEVTHAIDEVGAMLIDAASIGSPLRCSFVVSGSVFLMTSTVTSRRCLPRHPGSRWRVLEALTDRVLTTALLGESEGESDIVVGFVTRRHEFT